MSVPTLCLASSISMILGSPQTVGWSSSANIFSVLSNHWLSSATAAWNCPRLSNAFCNFVCDISKTRVNRSNSQMDRFDWTDSLHYIPETHCIHFIIHVPLSTRFRGHEKQSIKCQTRSESNKIANGEEKTHILPFSRRYHPAKISISCSLHSLAVW